jgi:hypothetical protein
LSLENTATYPYNWVEISFDRDSGTATYYGNSYLSVGLDTFNFLDHNHAQCIQMLLDSTSPSIYLSSGHLIGNALGQLTMDFPLNPVTDLQNPTIVYSNPLSAYWGYTYPVITGWDAYGGNGIGIDGSLIITTTGSGFDDTNNIQMYIAGSFPDAAPEIDFIVGGSRAMVFGYDSGVQRGIFYDDNLGMGVFFYDGYGIAIGTDQATYAGNSVQFPYAGGIRSNGDIIIASTYGQILQADSAHEIFISGGNDYQHGATQAYYGSTHATYPWMAITTVGNQNVNTFQIQSYDGGSNYIPLFTINGSTGLSNFTGTVSTPTVSTKNINAVAYENESVFIDNDMVMAA